MEIRPEIKEKIVLALDVDNIEQAKELILELKDYTGVFKIGLQLYTGAGFEIFDFMRKEKVKFFFDIKLHDIPNTAAKAAENIIRHGASFFNIHTQGGIEMMRKTQEAARKTALELNRENPVILGVTLLTSINEEMLKNEFKSQHKPYEYALQLALNAKEAGLDGVVASVWEAKKIKQLCGKNFKVLCPGIRPEWAGKNDQKRAASPAEAVKEGADYIVIGRAVTAAQDRKKAAKMIYEEIENALLTQNKSYSASKGRLILENGMIFEGESIGAQGTSYGEIVFNTSMEGYQEILTDPSYAGQTIVMTYPEIGNYGINKEDFESGKIHAKGLIVKNICAHESHYKSVLPLAEYLKQNGIIALKGIDTRYLTQIIREKGTMNSAVTTENITPEMKEKIKDYKIDKNITLEVSVYKKIHSSGAGIKLAVIDTGIKNSILENFKEMNCDITLFPADTEADEILKGNFDAVLISNGPGDPKDAVKTIETAKQLLGRLPMAGICLGHQIICLAMGAETYKLKYGHRGANHPVMDVKTKEVFITAQNHSYAVNADTLPECCEVSYINLNDNTVEGISSDKYRVKTVQFHPELSAGPDDANKIIKEWIKNIEENNKCQKLSC